MYFHIDESGNTGLNLFDRNQRCLSYGVLSSKLNVDALGKSLHQQMINSLGLQALHASEMGMGGIVKIAHSLLTLQKKFRFKFDYYYIDKLVYALVLLFDAVFDAGLNKAVKWDLYWTPMRFLAILNLNRIADEELLKEGWALYTVRNVEAESERIVALLEELKARTMNSELDERSKELFCDAFEFGIRNPLDLDFGISEAKLVSPNAVGFQFVVYAIARRSREAKQQGSALIKIDQQQEFNPAQIETHHLLTKIAELRKNARGSDREMALFHPLLQDVDANDLQLHGMPLGTPKVHSSETSIGLQIVDLYLWIINRMTRGDKMPPEVLKLAQAFLRKSVVNSISLEGMARRFRKFESELPEQEDLTPEQIGAYRVSVEQHRHKVKGLLAGE